MNISVTDSIENPASTQFKIKNENRPVDIEGFEGTIGENI